MSISENVHRIAPIGLGLSTEQMALTVLYISDCFFDTLSVCFVLVPSNTKLDMCGYCTVYEPFFIPFPLFGLLVTISSLPWLVLCESLFWDVCLGRALRLY